jgi:CheY-like chemotaxis protein
VGDNKRLVQVLTNLLNNAAKYTPHGGEILLKMEPVDGQVEVFVQDNGIGMSSDLKTRAFELFAQAERSSDRSQGGLGIGLALVKRLVDLHGGSIRADSAGEGQGSRFTIRLPRVDDAKEAAGGISDTASTSLSAVAGLKVLIVDDNVDAANMLGMFLEAGGHKVFICDRPESGLERAAQVMLHICFVDIGLPGMDGYELARRLRRIPQTGSTVLVALTGYGQPQDREAAREAGFDHFFVKPMDMRQLTELIASLSERHGKGVAS